MKKSIKLLILTVLACAFALSMSACDMEGTINGLLEDPMGTIGGIFNPNEEPDPPNEGEQGNEEEGGNGGIDEVTTVTVAFETDPATSVEPITVTVGEVYTLPTPTYDGHNFLGWYFGGQKIEQTGVWGKTDESVLLRAEWEVKTYTLRFSSEGDVACPNDITISYRQTKSGFIESDYTLTRTGYQFTGWMLNDDAGLYITETMTWEFTDQYDGCADDVINLTACWRKINYLFTFTSEYGDNMFFYERFTIDTVSDVTLQTLTCKGYKFLGWKNGDEFVEEIDDELLNSLEIRQLTDGPQAELALTAAWKKITYTIVYENLDNQTHKNPTTFTIDSETTTLNNLLDCNLDFGGWKVGDKSITQLDESIIDYADENNVITITATWTESCWTANY